MYQNLHITAIIPALNEEQAIAQVVGNLLALQDFSGRPLVDAVIVADNGSNDATAALAQAAGASVVFEPRRGYGAACLAAIAHIKATDVVVFVDGDGSVNARQVGYLLAPIAKGADLVIGSRTLGYIQAGAMTWAQQVGTAGVAAIIGLLWSAKVSDLGPFRAIRHPALQALGMQDTTYGWTVEMQVKALQLDFTIVETPVDCLVRLGKSKISGTVRGVFGAVIGMLGMVMRLRWRQWRGSLWHNEPSLPSHRLP
ncbi:MAG: glycosyltransferase family 2 protein [Methylovulum sp.]|uniref:glycosyltransferase family 2 protein n=1 Tax=Methylovulum sp. TaxID=1916980 RepID=UPI002617F505|nr:glycosyltransferase family 2 protein [Methylovulum sp.]MDD2725566.1 glycosyltransferase family 2 protein [Methylovulum sp.]MDD5125364.1 glycosyltransferase family 2 protein [Methylovulum sp.]